jgi:2,3,4,5-tetrahydropyridine-2-carboxylate N-succinyltransferase
MKDGMTPTALAAFYQRPAEEVLADPDLPAAHAALLDALERGEVRAALPSASGWQVQSWIKQAILLGFRHTSAVEMLQWGMPAVDKSAYPPRRFTLADQVRLVPGGSAVRRGAFVGRGVVIMPPAYINVGAYVDEETMVDSHALVGSCAQIGRRVHLSAGAQVGGVLEPVGAVPVVIEDEAFIGGLVGLFEGVRVGRRAVIAAGVVLTASTTIYDLVHQREWQREVPAGAVVVPGCRPATGAFARQQGISLSAPIIVKYRDERTDAATALEGALRFNS